MKKSYAIVIALLVTLVSFSQDLLISEYRLRGPNGPQDEYIEIYNNSDIPHTVASVDGGTGYAVIASDGILRAIIPNGTTIPARGHYLIVNSAGYSLFSYPAGSSIAVGDATFITDIPDNSGIALFNSNVGANINLAHRIDAVGPSTLAVTLYREGMGHAAITNFTNNNYCFHRRQTGGRPQDTNENASDFKYEDTNGTSFGPLQSLGAPGPENLSSPVAGNGGIMVTYLDHAQPSNVAPNFVRDLTPDIPNNSNNGTIDLRLKITNNTGSNVTSLRLRVADITTFPAAAGMADLRLRTSSDIVVATSMGNVTVAGTTLQAASAPADQPNGGGVNSSMGVNTITLAAPLANGASQYIRVLMGVQQTGTLRAKFIIEALPGGGSGNAGLGTGASRPFGFSGNDASAFFNGDGVRPGDIVISEFRLTGISGESDEFIELYNTTDHDITVTDPHGSAGWSIVSSDGLVRATIPTGIVIRSHGHYLLATPGYTLYNYPSGEGTGATPDLITTGQIYHELGFALFSSATHFTLDTRLDAAGPVTESNMLYKEGAGYPVIVPLSVNWSFHRLIDASNASPIDNNNNATDFRFADPGASAMGAGQRIGAPGPQNGASPVYGNMLEIKRASPSVEEFAAPNFVRDLTPDVSNVSQFGTIKLRYCIKNIAPAPVTRIRLRMDSISTFPSYPGDVRLRTSSTSVVTIITESGSYNATVHGTTLEQPPMQSSGGGFNSSLLVNAVTMSTPLNPGDSIFVELLLGVQSEGPFVIKFTAEGIPAGAGFYGLTVLRGVTNPCNPITITNPAVTNGTMGVPFNQTFTSSGGAGTLTYTPLTALPTGLTLAPDGTLSGTPGQIGVFPFTLKVTDENGCTGTNSTYNLVIDCHPMTVNPVNNQVFCAGTTTTPIAFSGTPAGITFRWTNDNTAIGLGAIGFGDLPAFTAINNSASPVTATITVTPIYTMGTEMCTGTDITFTITVNPTVMITCPADITLSNTPGQCGAVVNYPAATATGGATITYSHPSGSVFPVGITTVAVTATNACATTNCTFTVRVNDTQAPVVNCPANINTTTTTGQCTRVVTYTPVATDNCSGVTVTANPVSGYAFPIGTTTVTVTATDAAGNISTCSFTVTVTDSQLPVITTQTNDTESCVGSDAVFTVAAANAVSYQWQVNTGSGFNNIAGATVAALTIPNVTMAMNNYKYRVIVQGLCSQVVSGQATLKVNALPTVSLTASPYTSLYPGKLTSIYATHDHTPGYFTWYRNNTLLRSTSASLLANLDVDSLGTYKVVYTDNKGCSVTSNEVTIIADPNFQFFVYPTPNNGRFTVRFYSEVLGAKRVMRVVDAKGAMVFRQEFIMNGAYHQMAVDLSRNSAGIYYVELHDANGKVLATGSTMVKK